MDNFMLHVQESVNLTIYLYAQTMRHRRMLYIRKFYVVKKMYIYNEKRNIFSFVYIHRWYTGTQLQWRVTTYARGGAWGGAKRPHQLGAGVA